MAGDEAAPRILLASASPRRKQLLQAAGVHAGIFPISLEEIQLENEEATAMARRLARTKAERAYAAAADGEIIVAADTIVVDRGRVLGKPADGAEATEMLMDLRGREHEVVTAVAVINGGGPACVREQVTRLRMRNYQLDEVEAYVASGSPLDKAGAYGIQDEGFAPVAMDGFRGCYTNVMGLPLCTLAQAMEVVGVVLGAGVDLRRACFAYHPHPLETEDSFVG